MIGQVPASSRVTEPIGGIGGTITNSTIFNGMSVQYTSLDEQINANAKATLTDASNGDVDGNVNDSDYEGESADACSTAQAASVASAAPGVSEAMVPAVGADHTGDRRLYFAHKHIKLAEQNAVYYSKDTGGNGADVDSHIFANVVCFINSETSPPGRCMRACEMARTLCVRTQYLPSF